MNGNNRGRRGNGGGRGRKGGMLAGSAVGTCLCPKYRHSQPHVRNAPRTQVKYPQRGTATIRE